MNKGITLVQLLIVLLIIAIIATLSYPTYTEYLVHSRRMDGQQALFDLAARMESYYKAHNSYQNATMGTGGPDDVRVNNRSTDGWYMLVISTPHPASYILEAVPLKQQAQDDSWCQTLTLDNFGNKGITNGPKGIPQGPVDQCWQ